MKSDPMNMDVRIDWIAVERALAKIDARSGRPEKAVARLEGVSALVDEMVRFDPSNSAWRDQKTWLGAQMSGLQRQH
jgi:hypothetical protein